MFDKINEWQERIETFREQVQSKEKSLVKYSQNYKNMSQNFIF